MRPRHTRPPCTASGEHGTATPEQRMCRQRVGARASVHARLGTYTRVGAAASVHTHQRARGGQDVQLERAQRASPAGPGCAQHPEAPSWPQADRNSTLSPLWDHELWAADCPRGSIKTAAPQLSSGLISDPTPRPPQECPKLVPVHQDGLGTIKNTPMRPKACVPGLWASVTQQHGASGVRWAPMSAASPGAPAPRGSPTNRRCRGHGAGEGKRKGRQGAMLGDWNQGLHPSS